MSGDAFQVAFPNLNSSNFVFTSPKTRRYNCIAWAAGETIRKWWPDQFGKGYWPPSVPRLETLDAFIDAYGTLGYTQCGDGSFDAGFEKVALFALLDPATGAWSPTHAAIQLGNGHWSSKLGDYEDIEHFTVDGVAGPIYGQPVCYLRRAK